MIDNEITPQREDLFHVKFIALFYGQILVYYIQEYGNIDAIFPSSEDPLLSIPLDKGFLELEYFLLYQKF